MQEPILEPLSFDFESALSLNDEKLVQQGDSTSAYLNSELKKAIHNFSSRYSSTPCPSKDCDFTLEGISDPLTESFGETQVFLKHLLVQHNLVIDEVRNVANFHKYMLHWKRRFDEGPITDFCVGFWMDSPMTNAEAVSKDLLPKAVPGEDSQVRHQYFMLTDALPEDKELRASLWSERLENILEINRLEREQTDFSRRCLFCKEICTGNRSHLFLHMAKDHGFHIGQPDNIIFVHELLDLIESQLQSLNCICCEKTFKERAVLKEHMRKKQHKRINPLNPEYDRFYIVNYLESGKTWQVLDSDTEDVDDRKEEEWLELKDEVNHIVCLFCSSQFTSYDQTLNHMLQEHHFDFEMITKDCDFYQKVKIVNFIRRNMYQSLCMYCEHKFMEKISLLGHLKTHQITTTEFSPSKLWDHPEHFFPTYENDQFLMFLEKDEFKDDAAMESDSEANRVPDVIPEDISEIKVPPPINVPDLEIEEF